MSFDSTDSTVKSIEFLSLGMLPVEHTLETLKQLPNVDVSNEQDKSILAYCDNSKLYVYSENLIMFNKSSKYMFSWFESIETIEFGDIDTSKVTNMNNMFLYTGTFEVIIGDNWTVKNATTTDMFKSSNITNQQELLSK